MSVSAIAQYDYVVSGADKVKTGHKVFPRNFFTEELSWGALQSKCLSGSVKYGKWLQLTPKSDQVTFTIVSGMPNGDLEAPTVYIGKVIADQQGQRIEEVKCRSFEKAEDNRYALSVKGLTPKGEYFVLVTSAKSKASFAIQVTGEYTPDPEPVQVKPQIAKIKTRSIAGRVSSRSTGLGIASKKVELLDDEMRLIKSVFTDDRGGFRFEKLPVEEVYLTRIEEEDPDFRVDMFLFNEDGEPEKRAVKVGDRLYGFPAPENGFRQLILLTDADWVLGTNPGMVGIIGRVVDRKTLTIGFQNVRVGLYNKSKKRIGTAMTDEAGRFEFLNRDKADYLIKYDDKPADSYSEIVMVDDKDVPFVFSTSLFQDGDGYFQFEELPRELVELKRMEVADTKLNMKTDFSGMAKGDEIVLNNILFASGSYELLPASFKELDELAEALKKQANLKITISGHTDNTGNENTNLILSQNRAKAVRQYLESKGVESTRLRSEGYGSQKPRSSNDSEEGRKKNRRVEFVVEE